MKSLIKHPSAWLPIVLSLIVLVFMFSAIVLSGPPTRQPDEGTAAHLFQIWLMLEACMILFFGFTWLPQKPKETFIILILQIVLVVAGCAPVAYFHL